MPSLSPEFQHDVFISYSHGDAAKTGKTPLKTWSQAFARELMAELRSPLEWTKADVFLDKEGLDRADPLTRQLRESICRSAILLILMSPHYIDSPACADERAWWFEKAATEAFPEVRSRVVVARIWPLSEGLSWPSELCDEAGVPPLGVWFHEQPGHSETSRPFGWRDPTGAEGEFRRSLLELVTDITLRLGELKRGIERKRRAAAFAAKLSAPAGQAIYVHARKRDAARWEAVREKLILAGYGVVPNAPEALPDSSGQTSDLEDESLQMLKASDGLLLISGDNPNHLASDLVVIGHQRRNSARAASGKPLPCAVIDPGLVPETKLRHQQSAKNMQIDWINASISDWTAEVKSWLNAAADPERGVA